MPDDLDHFSKALGPIRRWQEGDIMFVENAFLKIAYVYTDDPGLIGTVGWHDSKPVWVEYIARSAPVE